MKKNIFFIGFMGTGKSTIAKLVSKRLGLTLVDTDSLIEEKSNMNIANIFKEYGESYFRKLEHEVIQKLSNKSNLIISTGGGAPLYYRNIEIMKQNRLVLTLEASVDILW